MLHRWCCHLQRIFQFPAYLINPLVRDKKVFFISLHFTFTFTFHFHFSLLNLHYTTWNTNIFFNILLCYTVGNSHRWASPLTRALLGLWIFHHLLGGGVFEHPPPRLSRLLRIIEQNGKRRSKAREKSFRNQFSHFLAHVKIEVTRGQNSKIFQNGFWTIKSLILKVEQRLWYHRVFLVKARRTMYNVTLKGQGQNLTSGQVRAKSLGDPSRSPSDHQAHHSMRLAETNAMTTIPRLYLIWFSSYWQKTVGDLKWPPWPLEGSPTNNFTWSINKYLTWCDSIHISSRWRIKQGVYFCPLTYNGEVT